jgi:hypothetical protein
MEIQKKIMIILSAVVCVISVTQAFGKAEPDNARGVIVGENVRVREEANASSRIITSLNTGDMLRVTAHSSTMQQLVKSRAYRYRWYSVVLPSGKKGWVYGQFIYSMHEEKKAHRFTFKGKTYQLIVAKEQAASIEELPAQSTYAMPGFLDEKTQRFYPFYMHTRLREKIRHRRRDATCKQFFLFHGNAGFSEQSGGKPLIKKNLILLPVFVGLQEGTARYTLKIIFQNKKFQVIDIIDYTRHNP